jgi:NADH-quinone oxidoreductase subunit H
MAEFFTSQLGVSVGLAVFALLVLLGAVSYCIYFERKISAFVQDRYGPNRVGPFGIFQPIADGGKFVFKEDIVPGHVDKPLFLLAPCITFLVGFVVFAAIPWGGQWKLGDRLVEVQVANPDIGLLYILGVASVGIYGVILGSWASNNKYSFFGGMRAAAQILSYEIPMGICILVVVITMGSLRLEEITTEQTGYWLGCIPQWNVFRHPLAFVILFITVLAECNRAPFDLVEAEQELVGGFHTEYSALKFGMFFLAEYAHMITSGALIAVLFLGGWHFPWIPATQPESTAWYSVLLKILVICGKISLLIFFMMWIRWTLPRFRFDQLMRLAWKGLIPITLCLFVLAVVLLYLGLERSLWYPLIGNVVVLGGALFFAARSRREITGRQSSLPAIGGGEGGPMMRAGIPG